LFVNRQQISPSYFPCIVQKQNLKKCFYRFLFCQLLLITLAFPFSGIGQVITGSGFSILDSWDNVLSSTDNGNYYQLIGTYRGWDANAVYVAGYNATNLGGCATQRLYLGNPNNGRFLGVDFTTGNVGIGATSPTEKLSVNGNIKARKLIVTQNDWSDYVFDSSYRPQPLSLVEEFIKQNKHLPDIPSAKEVSDKGLDVGDNQALLLKKVEELTLYMIEQNKKIDAIQKENEEIKKQNQSLVKEMEKLRIDIKND
jgi:hypothetical protein